MSPELVEPQPERKEARLAEIGFSSEDFRLQKNCARCWPNKCLMSCLCGLVAGQLRHTLQQFAIFASVTSKTDASHSGNKRVAATEADNFLQGSRRCVCKINFKELK